MGMTEKEIKSYAKIILQLARDAVAKRLPENQILAKRVGVAPSTMTRLLQKSDHALDLDDPEMLERINKIAEAIKVVPPNPKNAVAITRGAEIDLNKKPTKEYRGGLRLFRTNYIPLDAMRKEEKTFVGGKTLQHPFFIVLPPNCTSEGRPELHDGEETAYVIKGSVRAIIGGNEEVKEDLKEGDVIHLFSRVPHRFENHTKHDARMFFVRERDPFIDVDDDS